MGNSMKEEFKDYKEKQQYYKQKSKNIMFIAYPLLSRLLQAYQNTHRVLTNYQESNILPSDIRHSIPRKCDENIFGRSSDSSPIHTPSHPDKSGQWQKYLCESFGWNSQQRVCSGLSPDSLLFRNANTKREPNIAY